MNMSEEPPPAGRPGAESASTGSIDAEDGTSVPHGGAAPAHAEGHRSRSRAPSTSLWCSGETTKAALPVLIDDRENRVSERDAHQAPPGIANGDVRAAELRAQLVDVLTAEGSVRTKEVEVAFRAVPRHLFAPEVSLEDAYADDIVRTKRDENGVTVSSVSAPWLQATMLEQAGMGVFTGVEVEVARACVAWLSAGGSGCRGCARRGGACVLPGCRAGVPLRRW